MEFSLLQCSGDACSLVESQHLIWKGLSGLFIKLVELCSDPGAKTVHCSIVDKLVSIYFL